MDLGYLAAYLVTELYLTLVRWLGTPVTISGHYSFSRFAKLANLSCWAVELLSTYFVGSYAGRFQSP